MQSISRHLSQSCADELPVQERLNYFTGQFLTERDLKAEQGYQMGKHRQHNRYLHGYGAVCGLRVKEHPNPACRDRFVVLEPGLALDCHGREVMVPEAIYVDLQAALAAQKADPTLPADSKNLLISLCYSECKTELVPALYADCGCNDTGCEASRIYEGFEVEAKLVTDAQLPKSKLVDPTGVRLDWTSTLTTDKAVKVAIDPKQTRIYVLNAATLNQIMVYDTKHYCLLKSISFVAGDGRIIDLAVSSNGNFLYVLRYVVTTPATTPESGNYFLRVIQVKDTTGNDLDTALTINDISLTAGSETSKPQLVVGSKDTSGKVVTLDVNATSNKITLWTDSINTAGANLASAKYYEGYTGDGQAIAITPDGSWLFIAEANSIQAFKVASLPTSQIPLPIAIPNSEKPSLMAVSGDSLWLYVITETKKVYVFRIQETPTPFPPVNTTGVDLGADTPIALQVSPTGKWGYVLLQGASDATKGWVKVINRDKLLDDPGQAVSGAIAVTATPRDLALATDGQRLYAAGEGADKACGGVSVLNVSEDHCKDLFWRSLEHCPECVETCIPLAVVKDYATDAVVTDARINNRIRPLVPSTETLQQLILCALNSASKPATPTTGAGVKSADAQTIAAGLDADASFDPVTGNIHFKIPKGEKGSAGTNGAPGVEDATVSVTEGKPANATVNYSAADRRLNFTFQIPPGRNGEPGKNGEGLEENLTQIVALSWTHRSNKESFILIDEQQPAFVIGFSRPVNIDLIDVEHIFQVLIQHEPGRDKELGVICRCPVQGKIIPVEPLAPETKWNPPLITKARSGNSPFALGAAFLPANLGLLRKSRKLWICLRGDFVVDKKNRAVDAEFVRGELPTGDRPSGSSFGVQGGLFESWFTLSDG